MPSVNLPTAPPVVVAGFYCADNKQSAPLWTRTINGIRHVRITHAHILRYVNSAFPKSSTTVTLGLSASIRHNCAANVIFLGRYRLVFVDAHIIHIDKRDCANPLYAASSSEPAYNTTKYVHRQTVVLPYRRAICQNADAARITNYHEHSTSNLKGRGYPSLNA